MREIGRRFEHLVAALGRRRLGNVELYLKEGRSHRVEITAERTSELRSEEAGWAVRAGHGRGSFFCCGTGRPRRDAVWPEPAGAPLRLPAPRAAATRTEAPSAQRPLIVESEALAQLRTFRDALGAEAPGAAVVRAVLEDGESEARLRSSEGVDCRLRGRAASLYLEVAKGDQRQSGAFAARAAEDFDPRALARRFGTLLSLVEADSAGRPSGAEVVLAPPVAARLLAGLLPILLGAEARARARKLGHAKRLASPSLTVVDDGGLAEGVLCSAFDGEGVPTRAVTLIERGAYVQPLLSWREAKRGEGSGCSFRPSWRQPPEPGPTHLFVRPDPSAAPGDLVRSVRQGLYALEPLGAGRFDLDADSYELPVAGLGLERGQAAAPVPRIRMSGRVSELLHSIQGVARDLTFQPLGCLLGAPTLLLADVELDEPAY